jgi:hypothetical protein
VAADPADPADPVVFWFRVGILAASSVPVVIFAVSKSGILAASSVPVICAAGMDVSPDPSPKNVAAVTFPVTILFEFTIKPVVAFVN